MIIIAVENYLNAKVQTIAVANRKLFWVKMHDVQDGLELKNLPDLVRKEMWGIFETKDITDDQKRNILDQSMK